MEYIAVTFIVRREADYYVSECLELGTATFGLGQEEALENLTDATEVYLETLEDLGECHRVLEDRGVRIYPYKPADLEVGRGTRFPVTSVVYPTVMPLQGASV